jgi:hypothetical protein
MEERTGTISDVNGELIDSYDGLPRQFTNPAQVTFIQGDSVTYISIITPGGKREIINVIKGKKNI